MAVQIVRNQIEDSIIDTSKINDGAVAFLKIEGNSLENTTLVGAASKLASAAVIKTYIDQLDINATAGPGIEITRNGTGDDKISMDLFGTSGLEGVGGGDAAKLRIKLDNNSLFIASTGIKVNAGGISATELATDSVETAKINALAVTAAKLAADSVETAKILDLNVTTGKIDALAVTAAKLAANSVETAKIIDDAVTADKVGFGTNLDTLTVNGTDTEFDLGATINSAFAIVMLHRNGLLMSQVAASPSGVDQFSLSLAGGTAGVSQVTFGTAPSTADSVTVFYIA